MDAKYESIDFAHLDRMKMACHYVTFFPRIRYRVPRQYSTLPMPA